MLRAMNPDALTALTLAGVALAGSPGPNTLSLAAAGAAFGARRSAGYMLGLAAGMLGVMLVVASGVVAMLLALPGAAPIATGAALLYFLWLAWRIATAPVLGEGGADRLAPTARDGVFLSLVNPKGYAAMLALFSGRVVLPGRLVADAGLKIAVIMAIILVVNVAWLNLGAGFARLVRSPRAGRLVNLGFAASLLASAALLVPR
jgi:threonine/homoserine/homoserine lactone efflux protein